MQPNKSSPFDVIQPVVPGISKVPLSVMAQSIMLNHVSEGVHTMDMGILVMPVIIELLITFAELSKVDYIVFPDQIEKQNIIPVGVARLAMKKALESMEKTAEQVQETKPAGLMARKQKEVM